MFAVHSFLCIIIFLKFNKECHKTKDENSSQDNKEVQKIMIPFPVVMLMYVWKKVGA